MSNLATHRWVGRQQIYLVMFHLSLDYGHSLLFESIHKFCLSLIHSHNVHMLFFPKCKSDPVPCPRTVFPSHSLVDSSLSFRFQELNHHFLGKPAWVFLTWLNAYIICLYSTMIFVFMDCATGCSLIFIIVNQSFYSSLLLFFIISLAPSAVHSTM